MSKDENRTSRDFIAFACEKGVLRFGEFRTKAGRLSPYFFNTGLFNDGASLARLAEYYAETILAAKIPCDMLFGPAYKGIPLVAATAISLAAKGHNLPFAFNRKESKDHGEGGTLIGAALSGRVLIIDDVISAGTSVRESVDIIRAAGAQPIGVVIAIDRQERGSGEHSAVQETEREHKLPVFAVAKLTDVIDYLQNQDGFEGLNTAMRNYRDQYGAV